MNLAQTTIAAVILTTGVVGTAKAQEEAAAAAEPTLFCLKDFGFTETINFYNYSNIPNTTEFIQNAHWSLSKDVTLDITVPFYTNGSTGLGMASVGLSAPVIQKPFSFMDSISVGFDLKLPTSSADFGGDGVNPVVSLQTNGSTPVENIKWDAAFSYEWNSDGTFSPVLGGLVFDDVLQVSGSLSREIAKDWTLSANLHYTDGFDFGQVTTIGPALNWTACPNAEFSLGIDFPISDSESSDLTSVVGFKASLTF